MCSSLAAATAQSEAQKVFIIDKCPEEWAGGNSFFTAGAFRTSHDGLEDLLPLVNNVDQTTAQKIEMAAYTEADFTGDMNQPTESAFSFPSTVKPTKSTARSWFWGRLALKTEDGGKGLIQDHIHAAQKHGISVFYSTAAQRLIRDQASRAVTGVEVVQPGQSWVWNLM
ncbi:succinate dehydrogenase/fumarate reductase [Aspergillus affinis]|uniref:succinate dehydrogenase/fumarate reductase n=1 Tax=Aspergillus affinis TaxID=1070780 RepID=UPI0022FEC6F3|nr:succinate dehydrogenase/fumarate reductase [Aspergillus affinis]KAI9043820.1 succinate dehydrogenase/fumarate reductase [Aspergillus affinis]